MKLLELQPIPLYVTILLFSFFSISACTQKKDVPQKTETDAEVETVSHEFAAPIQKAHKMSDWKNKGAMKTNINLQLGSNALNATLFVETGGPGILLEMGEDTVALFDGQEMYAMPSDSAVSPFTLKTWAYFLNAPYKLNDPGTQIESQPAGQMKGQNYDRAKLTFEPGTGDTPDDWYMIFRDQSNNRLRAMSYIVTAGSSVEEANKNPHAISYEDFEMIEGVPIATTWKFWGWSEAEGVSEEPIGEANLTNIEFLNAGTLFTAPEDAKKMKR